MQMKRMHRTCAAQVYDTTTKCGYWVAVDGETFDFGNIDSDDFYDPEGGKLFDSDDEPDEEEYEGYTGNAGAAGGGPRLFVFRCDFL